MDKITADWLARRIKIISTEIKETGLGDIDKLADSFKFENRRVSNPKECPPFYKSGEFCHDGNGEEKYCLLCSCNHYNNSKDEGGCRVGNPFATGKPLDRFEYGKPEIWDCGNCFYPHTKIATQRFLRYVKRKTYWKNDLERVLGKMFGLVDEKV